MKLGSHKLWFIFGAALFLRIGWNLLHPHDLYLDSWVMVHILDALNGRAELLPRAAISMWYPFSYIPFWLPARLWGGFATVKYIYPAVSSLIVIPAYLVLRKGRAPAAGAFAVLLFSDISFKTLTGTPQAIAIPLFVLALYFILNGRHTAFVLTAGVILFTHHLTGMVALILYYTVWVLPHSRQPGFLRREWSYLVFFAFWPFYWAWTFSLSGQTYMASVFLILYVTIGLPLALSLYILTPFLRRQLDAWGAKAALIKPAPVLLGVSVVSLAAWSLAFSILRLPFFSEAPAMNSLFAIICACVIALGGVALLVRRDIGLALFMLSMVTLAGVMLLSGYNTIFDGLRFGDFILVGVTVIIFSAGFNQMRASRILPLGILAAVVLAYGLHITTGYQRYFSYTSGEFEAAKWLKANTAENETIATDTKMSLLVLGLADRNATYEGSSWIFDTATLKSSIDWLNSGNPPPNIAQEKIVLGQYTTGSAGNKGAFIQRPIRYVLLDDYMLTGGAEVSWFSPPLKTSLDLENTLDELGNRVYSRGGITIWKLA